MNNLFQISYDKSSGQSKAKYDNYIIRKVNKKQEEKLVTLGKKYKTSEQNKGMPKWLYYWNRIAFSATFTSFIFLIVSIFSYVREKKENYVKDYLWIIIIFAVSFVAFVLSMILAIVKRKKTKEKNVNQASKDLFETILETSKEYLNVPADAKTIEILMNQPQEKKADKIHKFSNVLLSVFVEKEMLCFADLYVVIGIPLQNLADFEIINEAYRFRYWHKDKSMLQKEEYQIKVVTRPVRCYQASQYTILKLQNMKEELGIYFPSYEIEELKKILQEKREQE